MVRSHVKIDDTALDHSFEKARSYPSGSARPCDGYYQELYDVMRWVDRARTPLRTFAFCDPRSEKIRRRCAAQHEKIDTHVTSSSVDLS